LNLSNKLLTCEESFLFVIVGLLMQYFLGFIIVVLN